MNNYFFNYNDYRQETVNEWDLLPTLQEGSTAPEVKILQQMLKMLSLFSESITGSFGIGTKEAVLSFQKEHGLEANGIVDTNTWRELFLATESPDTAVRSDRARPTLRLGSTGSEVSELQKELTTLLYYSGTINGNFDKTTENAVKAFQLNNNLIATGVVVSSTWDALSSMYAPLTICGNTSPAKENNYTVQKGDTLYSIAQKFDTTVDNIKNLNNLTSNTLSVGQTLKVPSSTSEPSTPKPEPTASTYTVKSGDTLYSVAQKFNTTVDNIKNLNNLTSNTLSIGQTLKVPTTSESKVTYIVKPGDSLYSIAKIYNTTVDAIKNLNELTSNMLNIGQTLSIPR